jgi:hypothetical protein
MASTVPTGVGGNFGGLGYPDDGVFWHARFCTWL